MPKGQGYSASDTEGQRETKVSTETEAHRHTWKKGWRPGPWTVSPRARSCDRTHSVFCNSPPRPCCSRTGCSAAGSAGLCEEHKSRQASGCLGPQRRDSGPRAAALGSLACPPWPRTVQCAQALRPGEKAAADWRRGRRVNAQEGQAGSMRGESPSALAAGAGQTAAAQDNYPGQGWGAAASPWWAEPDAPTARPTSPRDQPSKRTRSKWHRALSTWPLCAETDGFPSAANRRGTVPGLCSRC